MTTALGMKQLTEDLLKNDTGGDNPPKDTSSTEKEDKIAKLLQTAGREAERQRERDKARLESGGAHTPGAPRACQRHLHLSGLSDRY